MFPVAEGRVEKFNMCLSTSFTSLWVVKYASLITRAVTADLFKCNESNTHPACTVQLCLYKPS